MITRIALVLGLGLVPLAAQSSSNPGAVPHQGQMLKRMARFLNLTDSQKTGIQAIYASHEVAIKADMQAAKAARTAFWDAMKNPDTTAAQLQPLYQTQSDKNFILMLDHRAMQNEIRAILTPEQRAEMDKFQASHQGMKHGRGMGGPGMGL